MENSKQSSPKRQKENPPSIDRLSALPDDVACHILSFLLTRASVKTSVLARRWRYLWAHVPNICFNGEFFRTQFEFGKQFSDVIYRVMLLYKVRDMNTFCLSYADDFNEYQLETCVITAILRNVKKIDLIFCNDKVKLPNCIFNCQTLVDLSLDHCSYIPGHVCLPALKRLYLFLVGFQSTESLARLISGCPVLEDLTIYKKLDSNLFFFCVSSPTLIRLTLDSHENGVVKSYKEPSWVKLDTPALRYLQLKDSMSEDFSVGSLNSLIEAHIVFSNGTLVERDLLYSRSVLKFGAALGNVRFLKLSSDRMKVCDSEFSASTIRFRFNNLTRLELDADSRFITSFLDNADNLEVLIIRTVFKELKCWMEPHVVPRCFLSRLSTVRIDQFECLEDEFKMVRYILRNAKVLRRMEIFLQPRIFGSDKKLDALKRIALFQRGSEACELAFD